MLSGVRAHRVGVVEPKTQVRMLRPHPLNSHQQPVLLDRLPGNRVKKTLHRLHGPFVRPTSASGNLKANFPDASETVRIVLDIGNLRAFLRHARNES
jgi:hypothetical protein